MHEIIEVSLLIRDVDYAFNSLFEMPDANLATAQPPSWELSILYLRCKPLDLDAARGMVVEAFNSLFEMQTST